MEDTKETKTNSIIDFLKKINKQIRDGHNKDKANGKDFNIFSIMDVQTEEVKLHSAFIAELLNPNGSHGQKAYFIEQFIKEYCKKYTSTNWNNADVHTEVSIGPISEDLSTGGRLDILISSSDIGIAIENKIYAAEQKKQLDRYYNYLKGKYKSFELLYLTLYGQEASKNSASETTDYSCISYSRDIINWLTQSLKNKPKLPENVREAIKQYIDVLRYLTGNMKVEQMNDNEKEAVIDKLLEDDNLVLFEEYSGMVVEAKNVLFRTIVEALHKLENTDLKLEFENEIDFSCKETGFDFSYKKVILFSFVFNSSNYNQFYYGITNDNIPENMKMPSNRISMRTASTWYCWDYFDENFRNLTTQKLVEYAKNPEPFVDAVRNAIERMKLQIKDC